MSFLSNLPATLRIVLPLAAGGALAGAIAWGASGGAGGGGASEDRAAAAPTATVQPEKASTPPWDPARPDCPQGWRVYNDPDGYYSLCHPPGLSRSRGGTLNESVSSAFAVADPENVASRNPVNVFSLNIYRWKISLAALGMPLTDAQCSGYTGSVSPQARAVAARLTIDSRPALGCKAEGSLYDARAIPAQSIRVFIPAAADGSDHEGFIVILINSIGPDFGGTFNRAEQILNTIRLR